MHLFSEQFQDAYEKAIQFLDNITQSSRLGAQPDRATLSFLRATAKSGPYVLFRGLSFDSLPDETIELGQPCPVKYERPQDAPICIHTSLDKDVALGYASSRKYGFIYQIDVDGSQVMFDSTGAKKTFPDLTEEKKDYFDRAREVLLLKDSIFSTKIIHVIA